LTSFLARLLLFAMVVAFASVTVGLLLTMPAPLRAFPLPAHVAPNQVVPPGAPPAWVAAGDAGRAGAAIAAVKAAQRAAGARP
jgi:hypothetical protein